MLLALQVALNEKAPISGAFAEPSSFLPPTTKPSRPSKVRARAGSCSWRRPAASAVARGLGAVAAAFHRAPAAAARRRVVDEHQRAGRVGAVADALQFATGDELDRVSRELRQRCAARVRADQGHAQVGVELRTRCASSRPGIDELAVGAGRGVILTRSDDDSVDRLAQLAGTHEKRPVTACSAGDPGQLEPTAEISRLDEPLDRPGAPAGAGRYELERRVPESHPELVLVHPSRRSHFDTSIIGVDDE